MSGQICCFKKNLNLNLNLFILLLRIDMLLPVSSAKRKSQEKNRRVIFFFSYDCSHTLYCTENIVSFCKKKSQHLKVR